MDFYDATALMRLVQAVENDPYVSSGAGEALADKVREFIEDEAELGGWYTELMNAIGEGEITDPLADFTVGRFRVHLVQEGERYGAGGGFRVRQGPVERQLRHPNQRLPALRPRSPSGGVLRRVAGPRKVPRGPVRHPLLHVHPARHGLHRR